MGLLDDLDLGRDQFKDKQPLKLEGLNQPLPKAAANPRYDWNIWGDPASSQTSQEELHNWEEPVDQSEPEVNVQTQQAYKDIKSFDSDISRLTSDIGKYNDIHSNKKKALEEFHEGTLSPFWKEQFSEGFLEAPDLDLDKPETIDAFTKDIDDRYAQFQSRVDEGDTSWFGEDEDYTRASGALRGKRKYDLIKQKHGRLLKDYHQSKEAAERAKARKTAMSETLMSLPENLRWAAKQWKEENPGEPLSQERVNKLLDDQKFEKPQWGPMGELLNPGKVDPRAALPSDGSDYIKKANKGQRKRLEAVRREGIQALKKDISELETRTKLKKHGFLYSLMGQVANRSIYISDSEKEAINVDALKKAGITTYKGVDIDSALEALGGEDRVIGAKLVENVGNAHVAYERAKVYWIESLRTKGLKEAKKDLDLAKKNYHASLNSAIQAGFGMEVADKGRSDSYYGHLANAWKSGDLLEDATDFVPQLAGLADFSKADAQQFIDIMTEMEGLENSESYTKYKMTEVDGFWDGIQHFLKHADAIPEMVVETIVGFMNTYATEAPRVVGASAGIGATIGAVGGPKGALAGAKVGAARGMKVAVGVSSFVMEYVGALMSELEKAGVDWHNPNELMAAFNNPELMTELRNQATLKSGPVAILDMLSAGVAGKTLKLFKNPSALKKLPNGMKAFRQELRSGVHASNGRITAGMAAELGVQGGLGGAGEAIGQLLTLDPGEKLDWKAIIAEMGVEAFGPGGLGFAMNYAKSKFGGYAMEDISGATANVISREKTAGGYIEQVDQAGFKYERRRFNTAQDYLDYVVEQTGMDLNSPTGFLVQKMVGFAQTAGKIGDLGIVVADRTPFKNKNTRGAYSNGVIWLNNKALQGRQDSTPFVFLHEGGHYIQDMFFTPEQARDLYTKALPEEEARKIAWAQYKLGRSVESLSDLSNSELSIVNESFSSTSENIQIAEWFTGQVAAALAIESGVAGGTKVDTGIKKAVKTLMKFITSDENANQFFPADANQESAIRIELLKNLGFDPVTLESNRASYFSDEEIAEDGSGIYNPFEVDLSNMSKWDKNTKDVWARILGYENWAALPQEYRRSQNRAGDKKAQRDAAGEGDPFAQADLSDPATQKRIREASDVTREVASEEQKGGSGVSEDAQSPEKESPSSKIKESAKSVVKSGGVARDDDTQDLRERIIKQEETFKGKEKAKEIAEEKVKKATESKVVAVSGKTAEDLNKVSNARTISKAELAKEQANADKIAAEFRAEKAKTKARNISTELNNTVDAIESNSKLDNGSLKVSIDKAISDIKKARLADIKSRRDLSAKQKQKLLKAAIAVKPIDVLREILIPGLESNESLADALNTADFDDIFAGLGGTLTVTQINDAVEKIGSFFEENFSELSAEPPLIDDVLIPYGVHEIADQQVVNDLNKALDAGTPTVVTLPQNVGEVGHFVNFKGPYAGGYSGFVPSQNYYAFEIVGSKPVGGKIEYTLKPVTEAQARKTVAWHELPAASIPKRRNKKENGVTKELLVNPFRHTPAKQASLGGRVKKENFRDPMSPVLGQYMSIKDALVGKSKTGITSAGPRQKSTKEIPARQIQRLARDKSGGSDYGLLESFKNPSNLENHEIDATTARMVATMILAALSESSVTSKRRVASMQANLTGQYDPAGASKRSRLQAQGGGKYEQTKLRRDAEGNTPSLLLGLYERIRHEMGGSRKNINLLGLSDLILIDLMGAERDFGYTKDQLRQEILALYVEPQNEMAGEVNLFRSAIDRESGESTKVEKNSEGRIEPTEGQRLALEDDMADIEAQAKGISPSVIGTPDEGGSETSTISKNTGKEKDMPADLIVDDADLANEKPREGTWQDEWLNGIGKEKEYNYVRRLAAKLKKSGQISKDTTIISHPEIRELDASLSRAEEDQRHSNRTVMSPRVVGNMVEKNGLNNMVALPDTNKQGRVTEGGPAGSALIWTGIMSKIVSNYGKITAGKKGVVDAGITPSDLMKRAIAEYNLLKSGMTKAEWSSFKNRWGGSLDTTIPKKADQFTAQEANAKKQFAFGYFIQWTRKRVAQMGGMEEKFGDKIATEGESQAFDKDGKKQEIDPDSPEGASVENIGEATEVESQIDEDTDFRDGISLKSDVIADALYKDDSQATFKSLGELSSGSVWGKVGKYLNMSDAELAAQPELRRLFSKGEITPDQARAVIKGALHKDHIQSVNTDAEVKKRLKTYIENQEEDAEIRAAERKKKRGKGPLLGSEYSPENQLGMPEVMRDYLLPNIRMSGASRRSPEQWIAEIKKVAGMAEYAEDMGLMHMLKNVPAKSITPDFIEGWLDANAPTIRVNEQLGDTDTPEGAYFEAVNLGTEYLDALSEPGAAPLPDDTDKFYNPEAEEFTVAGPPFKVLSAHRPSMRWDEQSMYVAEHLDKNPDQKKFFEINEGKPLNRNPNWEPDSYEKQHAIDFDKNRGHDGWATFDNTIFFATYQLAKDVLRVEELQSDWNQKSRSEIAKVRRGPPVTEIFTEDEELAMEQHYQGETDPTEPPGFYDRSDDQVLMDHGRPPLNMGWINAGIRTIVKKAIIEGKSKIAFHREDKDPDGKEQPIRIAMYSTHIPNAIMKFAKAMKLPKPTIKKVEKKMTGPDMKDPKNNPIGAEMARKEREGLNLKMLDYPIPEGTNMYTPLHYNATPGMVSLYREVYNVYKNTRDKNLLDNWREYKEQQRKRNERLRKFESEADPMNFDDLSGFDPDVFNAQENAGQEEAASYTALFTEQEAELQNMTAERFVHESGGRNAKIKTPPVFWENQSVKDLIKGLVNTELEYYEDRSAHLINNGKPGPLSAHLRRELETKLLDRIHRLMFEYQYEPFMAPKPEATLGDFILDISSLTEDDVNRISLYGIVPKNIAEKVNRGKQKRQNKTLGSELTLVSEMPALFSERIAASVMSTVRAGFNKIPEEWRYKVRVTLFNQHASLEDLAIKLNDKLNLKFGTDGRDFFDMMGVILPTYAKVKIASRDFDSRFRKPILKLLRDYGVSETDFGRYVQALSAGTFNRHVRGLLNEAKADLQNKIDTAQKKIDDHENTLAGEGLSETGREELTEIVKKYKADIKRDRELIKKHYDESLYENESGEFAPSGYSDREAAAIVNNARSNSKLTRLLKHGASNPSQSIMGLWARMNATTISRALETGQITQEEAFKLITSKSRAATADELVNIVFESLELDPTAPEYAEDVATIKATFNSDNWKAQNKVDSDLGLPSGYFYAPMRGFQNNEFQYEETEALQDLIKIKGGQSGWASKSSNEISKRVTGRRKGVDKPDPSTALAHAFLDHDAMVMRGAKIAPGQRMREFYELFLELFKNRDNLDGNIEWSDNFKEITEANGISKLFNDPAKRKIIFQEFNEIFDVINEEDLSGKMPTVEGTRLKKKVVDGKTRTVLRKGEIPISMQDPSIFLVKQKGELKFVKFNMKVARSGQSLTGIGARMKAELGNLNFVPTNPILKLFNVPTRFLAQMYTSFNPDFILANAVRDTINAMANIREDEKKKIFKDVASLLNPRNFYKVTKGIYKVERSLEEGKRSNEWAKVNRETALKIPEGDWESWFKFFEAHGLRTAFSGPDAMTNAMEDIQKVLGTQPTGVKRKISKAKTALLENRFIKVVEAANAGVENTVRLVVATKLLQSGFTIQQAVMAGRNISVDFNRKGTLSSSIGSLVLFFNAGVQGNLRFLRALANRDAGAAKIVVGIMTVSFMWGILQRLLTGHDEDEDGEKEGNHYDNLGDFERDSNLVAFIPGTDKNLRVPLPWGWNLIWMMGQKASNVVASQFGPAMGGSGVIANGASAMDNFYNTFNPVGETWVPGVFAPLYQVMQNETFYGAPITRKDRDFGVKTPASERSSKGTKDFFVDAAKSINKWLGGDEVTPGSLKKMFGAGEVTNEMDDMLWGLSGSDLEHIFEGYTGGPGAAFSRIISGAYAGLNGNADVNWKEVPVTRRFYREGYSSFTTSKRFYGLKHRVDVANEYVKNLKNGKNITQAKQAMLANKDLLKIKPIVDAADTKRKAIQRLIDKVNAGKLSESQKAAKIEEYEKQRVATWLKVLYKARKMGIDV